MQPETDYLARTVVDVVRHATQAGEAIMQVYATAFDVTQKADQSPLTQADLAAHGLLTAALSEAAPAFPILSEESQEIVFEERRAWTTYWLVDPLDGTREFVKRNDEFTVNIALVHDGEPVLGVVHAPALVLTYFAYVGGGAWRCRGAGTRDAEAIHVAPHVRDPVKVAGSRSHAGAGLQRFLAALGSHELISMGSSLKMCLVADGTVDIYPRFGKTSEWDTAAAQCVVEQAGGRVADLQLQPLRYNARESLLNPEFLVYADERKDWRAYL